MEAGVCKSMDCECLPNAIPDVINVDISNLGLHQYVRISELGLPQGVKVPAAWTGV